MAKPPLTVLRETVLKNLPTTVPVNGDTIQVGLVWMKKAPKTVPKPCWMVDYGDSIDITKSLGGSEEVQSVTEQVTDEQHTYATGQQFMVLEEMDVDVVASVKATVLGTPDVVLVAGTDYQVSDSDLDTAKDALEWLTGGTKPDDGTVVKTTYTHKLLEYSRAHLFTVPVIIHCVADPLEAGQAGATQNHEASEIIEAMQEVLFNLYEAKFRGELDAAGIGVEEGINSRNPLKLDGTVTIQVPNTFEANYETKTVVGARVRTVKKAILDQELKQAQ